MLNLRKHWALILVTAIALVNLEQCGTVLGWSSPMLVYLESKNSPIPLTPDQGSWLTTASSLVGIIGAPIASSCIQLFGRKLSLAFTIFAYALSWTIIATARNFTQLIIGRAIAGFGFSFTYTTTPIYLGEISPDHVRGKIGIFMTVMTNVGIVIVYALGLTESLWLTAFLAGIPVIIFPLFYFWLPESPYFLEARGQTNEAIKSLQKLRQTENIEEDLNKIKFTISQHTTEEISFWGKVKELFTHRNHLRALMICNGCITLSLCTGAAAILFYTGTIFKKAGDISPNILSIIEAGILLLFSLGSAQVVENIGKKPLLIISCTGSAIFMGILGIYFHFHDSGHNVDAYWWVPLVALIAFNVFQSIGLTPIPIAFLGELYHPKIKTIAVCLSKIVISILAFGTGKLFQVLADSLGNSTPFFIFTAFGVVGVPFILWFVPETKGRSLEDIQFYMENARFRTAVKENEEKQEEEEVRRV